MKKIAITLAGVLAGFVTEVQSAPKKNTWYPGATLGWSQYHDVGFYGNGYQDRIGNSSIHKNNLGTSVFLGYQAKNYLGFELGYSHLGRIPYKGSMHNKSFKAQGVQLSAKLNYPIVDNLDIYTRLGCMIWHADSKVSSNNIHRLRSSDTGASPLATVGAEYALTKNLATRIEYQFVSNIGNASTVGTRPDNSMINLGVSYRFGQNNMLASSVSPSGHSVETEHFILKSDILFDFNESTLKKEGLQSLEELYAQFNSTDQKDNPIIILGYADAIGSKQYNQALSEKRAKSVFDFLISKDIPSDKISIRGIGKFNSITGRTCNYISGRATKAQINCLAPDRRVEIKIKGIKEIVSKP